MAVSGTGGFLGWQCPVLLLVLVVQMTTVLILLHFSHYGTSIAISSKLVLGFTHALPPFCTLTFAHYFTPHLPLKMSIPDTISLIQQVRLSLVGTAKTATRLSDR